MVVSWKPNKRVKVEAAKNLELRYDNSHDNHLQCSAGHGTSGRPLTFSGIGK